MDSSSISHTLHLLAAHQTNLRSDYSASPCYALLLQTPSSTSSSDPMDSLPTNFEELIKSRELAEPTTVWALADKTSDVNLANVKLCGL